MFTLEVKKLEYHNNEGPAAAAPQSDSTSPKPVRLLKVGDFEFIKWRERRDAQGNVTMKESYQVVKSTYNPKQQKYVNQHISISDYGDAVQLKRLLELMDEKSVMWVRA